MLLVLFVVVLILPVFEAAANFFWFDPDLACLKIIKEAGDLFCKFQGHDAIAVFDVPGWYHDTCEVVCNGGPTKVRLPESACPPGGYRFCDENAVNNLKRWSDDMTKTKKRICQ
uniref:Putative ixodes 10 kDa peptide protein n=1 Tax=Ixodes ricinus TaxID=34613 RepID=A0A0K8R4Q2_IXORI